MKDTHSKPLVLTQSTPPPHAVRCRKSFYRLANPIEACIIPSDPNTNPDSNYIKQLGTRAVIIDEKGQYA